MKTGLKNYIAEHKTTLAISALLFLLLVIVAVGPLTYNVMADLVQYKTAAVQEKNAQINLAIIEEDYGTWRKSVGEDFSPEINEENFKEYANVYALLEQGKIEEANILKKQLELKQTYETAVVKSAVIRKAINVGDYKRWRKTVGEDFSPEVDEKNFKEYTAIASKAISGYLNQSTRLQIDAGIKKRINVYSSGHSDYIGFDYESKENDGSFYVFLISFKDRPSTVEVVMSITGWGLTDSKEFVDAAPTNFRGLSEDAAEYIKEQLKEVGAEVSIKDKRQ